MHNVSGLIVLETNYFSGIEVCPGSGARIYNEKRFPCEFCGRTFARGFDWERHIQRHSM